MTSGSRNDGLTLLEVLAAFLIFSLVFTVLVGSSQKGVQSQGVAARRLEANERADEVMTQLEIEMALNPASQVDDGESQDDIFTIRKSSLESGGLEGDIIALVEAQLPGFSKYLRRYNVEVEWAGNGRIEKVSRTTFDYDLASAQTDPASIFASGGTESGNAAGGAGPDGSDSDSGTDGQAAEEAGRTRGNGGPNSKSDAEKILEKMRAAGYTPP